ncbi:MAG: methylmalonyl Co-A mutase-associated GTPase MeaB [Candidatus Cloacimonetes bacterium]|nr:methylmalonyl Co-A mutase-associated GTPase MeaB [Candidatus Cloacimonadota bacterium]
MKGVSTGNSKPEQKNGWQPTRPELSIAAYVSGVTGGDRTVLGRAITLIESNSNRHIKMAQELLKALPSDSDNTLRIGITGVPGAGKSTFIEVLGQKLIAKGHRIAVLAIDPSSTLTRGSILGDKTRMEELSRSDQCFIRPSPAGGTLGGVTRKTRETIQVCEAADYDVIFVETVGVGQNEVVVRSMVDFFLLLKIAGAGDELQGIKKGVIELADAIIINKADGDNITAAETARADFQRALHYLAPATPGWTSNAFCVSAIEYTGVTEIWEVILKFFEHTRTHQIYHKRRQSQRREWMHAMLVDFLSDRFYKNPTIKKMIPLLEEAVENGTIPVTEAVQKLLKLHQ